MNETGLTMNFDDGTQLSLTPNTAMVMIDETGDEQLADPKHRLFGMGGCCILAKDFLSQMENPWKEIMKNHFHFNGAPFHVSGMRRIGTKKQKVLNKFFEEKPFGRFATVVSYRAENNSSLDMLDLVYTSLHLRIIDILKHTTFSDIVVIHEDSERLIEKLKNCRLNVALNETINEESLPIKTKYCKMSKQLAFSGLEIADYIIHSAGQAVRDKNEKRIKKFNDHSGFHCVFGGDDRKNSSFIHIDGVKVS